MSTLVSVGVLSFGVLLAVAFVQYVGFAGRLGDLVVAGLVAGSGSLVVAYGVRQFLRAADGGYYCCNHLYYQSFGGVTTVVGWVVVLLGLSLYRRSGA